MSGLQDFSEAARRMAPTDQISVTEQDILDGKYVQFVAHLQQVVLCDMSGIFAPIAEAVMDPIAVDYMALLYAACHTYGQDESMMAVMDEAISMGFMDKIFSSAAEQGYRPDHPAIVELVGNIQRACVDAILTVQLFMSGLRCPQIQSVGSAYTPYAVHDNGSVALRLMSENEIREILGYPNILQGERHDENY